jgi:hypothetical protein
MPEITELLLLWIERACATGKVGPVEMADALGFPLRPGYRGYAEAAETPDGIADITIGLDDEGGPVRFVQISLAESAVASLSDLEPLLAGKAAGVPFHGGEPDRVLFTAPRGSPGVECRVAVDLRGTDADGAGRAVAAVTIIV